MLTIEKVEEMQKVFKDMWLVVGDKGCKTSKYYEGIDLEKVEKHLKEKEKAERIKENRLLILGILFSPALLFALLYVCKVPPLINWSIFGVLLVAGNGYIIRLASKIANPITVGYALVKDSQEQARKAMIRNLNLLDRAIDSIGCKIDNINDAHEDVVDVRVYRSEEEGLDTICVPKEYFGELKVGEDFQLADIDIKAYELALEEQYKELVKQLS